MPANSRKWRTSIRSHLADALLGLLSAYTTYCSVKIATTEPPLWIDKQGILAGLLVVATIVGAVLAVWWLRRLLLNERDARVQVH